MPDTRPLSVEPEAFLDDSDPPVYVGFGSMAMHATDDPVSITNEVFRAQGRRVAITQGRANLALIDDRDDHGGCPCRYASGEPQIAHRPYWASLVSELGIDATHDSRIPRTVSLLAPLRTVLAEETREWVSTFAKTIRHDGAVVAAEVLVAAIWGMPTP